MLIWLCHGRSQLAQGCAMQGSISKVHTKRFRGMLLAGHAYHLHYMEIKKQKMPFMLWTTPLTSGSSNGQT